MTEADWIRANAEALRATEAHAAEMQEKIDEINQRFVTDPEFHARVYMAAKYLNVHVLTERERGDLDGRWVDALMSAIAVVAVLEKTEPKVCEMCRWVEGLGARQPPEHTCEPCAVCGRRHSGVGIPGVCDR